MAVKRFIVECDLSREGDLLRAIEACGCAQRPFVPDDAVTPGALGEYSTDIRMLRKSEAHFRALLEYMSVYVYSVVYRAGSVISSYHSPRCEQITGYTPEEFSADHDLWYAMILPEDRPLVDRFLADVSASNGRPVSVEHRIRHKNGEVRWILNTCTVRINVEKDITRRDGSIIDVTRRKAAEEALRESEESNRRIIDTALEGIIRMDTEHRIVYTNRRITEMLGFDPEEMLGRAVEAFLFPDDVGDHRGKMARRREGHGERYERRYRHKDGRAVWTIVSAVPLVDADGAFIGSFAMVTDITERKLAEDQLRKLSRAIEQSPASVVITDKTGTIEYVNPKFTRLTGYTLEEAIGENPRILKSGEQPSEYYRNLWKTILAGEEWQGEFHNRKKNGELYWEVASISPIRDAKGNIANFIAVKEDITRRKEAEEALRVSEEALKKRNQIFEKDLKLAQIIQSALLPRELPSNGRIHVEYRYQPMDEVGGDFFSFYQQPGGNLGVFIGDVAGHGISSALFLSLVKSVTERAVKDCFDAPAAYLDSINRELIGYMPSYFITGIYAYFDFESDPEGCRFVFSSGGHPGPVVVRSDGAGEIVNSGGTIIGSFDEARYSETSLSLRRGDRVFLYTDGIPETANAAREIIGFDSHLVDLLCAARRDELGSHLDAILGRVAEFRGAFPVEDDIIVIGFEVA